MKRVRRDGDGLERPPAQEIDVTGAKVEVEVVHPGRPHALMDQVSDRFIQRMLVGGAIVLGFVFLYLFLRAAADVLLLVFAGILFAVFLTALTDYITGHTPLSHRWAYSLVVITLLALVIGAGWFFASDIAQQVDEISQVIPTSFEDLTAPLREYEWGRQLLDAAPPVSEIAQSQGAGVFNGVSGTFSSAVSVLTDLVVIIVVGLFMAANPDLYRNGIIRLFPPRLRKGASETFNTLEATLQRWLVGQAVSMILVGLITALGLWLLGVPLALTLGLLAGLLEFIPILGPVIAFVPIVLIALSVGKGLQVIGLYLVIQFLESNVITPLVQKWAVEVPPALTLIGVVLFSLLFGPIGAFVATPLIAIAIILVKELYIEEVFHEPVSLPTDEDEDDLGGEEIRRKPEETFATTREEERIAE